MEERLRIELPSNGVFKACLTLFCRIYTVQGKEQLVICFLKCLSTKEYPSKISVSIEADLRGRRANRASPREPVKKTDGSKELKIF